jgi:proteasome alpha subunit
VVAEIDREGDADLYRIQYDGTVVDEQHWCCIGGDSEAVLGRLGEGWSADLERDGAVRLAVESLAGPDRSMSAEDLEVAILDNGNGRRCFRRLDDADTASLLAE